MVRWSKIGCLGHAWPTASTWSSSGYSLGPGRLNLRVVAGAFVPSVFLSCTDAEWKAYFVLLTLAALSTTPIASKTGNRYLPHGIFWKLSVVPQREVAARQRTGIAERPLLESASHDALERSSIAGANAVYCTNAEWRKLWYVD